MESSTHSPTRQAHERARTHAAHPTGHFEGFGDEVPQSLPARLFEQQVLRSPEADAVVLGSRRWSYSELDAWANGIATYLARHPDQAPVALVMANGPAMIASVLGALKAGRSFVPIDPSRTPSGRIAYILEDSGATLVVTTSEAQATVHEVGVTDAIDLDTIQPLDSAPEVSIERESVAWIIYTSGSTGHPKGVAQSHGNVAHFITTEAAAYRICSLDRCGVPFSSSVNFWYREVLSALIAGASVYPIDLHASGFAGLMRALNHEGITVLTVVPSLFRQFAPLLETAPPHLRILKLGGEPVLRTDVDLFKRHCPPTCVLINRFGTTETAPVRYLFMDRDSIVTDTHAPIGYPVDGSDLLVLGENGQEVGIDEPGELVVRSSFLALRYWNLPELTAQTFRPDPEDPTRRLYFTGDVGLLRRDGCVLHLGRKDQQVQIRGNRVELAEIEIALREHEQIRDAAAGTHTNARGEVSLVGYVVSDGSGPGIDQLRTHLLATLPDYMVPQHWMSLTELPRGPNGKILRKSLPTPMIATSDVGTIEALSDMEEIVARHWRKVLPSGQDIRATDRFFDLGGESLGVMQTIAWLEQETGARLDPVDMGRQTLGQIATQLERKATSTARPQASRHPGLLQRLLRRLGG